MLHRNRDRDTCGQILNGLKHYRHSISKFFPPVIHAKVLGLSRNYHSEVLGRSVHWTDLRTFRPVRITNIQLQERTSGLVTVLCLIVSMSSYFQALTLPHLCRPTESAFLPYCRFGFPYCSKPVVMPGGI